MGTTLAHGGGIPEAMMVLLPLALVIVMLRVGAKKTPPEDAEGEPGDGAAPPPGDPSDPADPEHPSDPEDPGPRPLAAG